MKISDERLDRFIQYHLDTTGNFWLNPTDLEAYKRLRRIFDLLCDNYKDRDIITIITKEHDIAESDARKAIKETQYVFSKRPEYAKEFYRTLLIEQCQRAIAMAFQKKDPVAIFMGIEKFTKLLGFDKEQAINPEDLQRHNYFLVLNNEVKIDLRQASQLSEKDKASLIDGLQTDIQDVQFEMINAVPTTQQKTEA